MGQVYNSYQDLLFSESEASEAYKKKKAAEQKASDKKERDRISRKGAALDSEWGGGKKGERRAEKEVKKLGNMSPSLKNRLKDAASGKASEKDAMRTGMDTMRAMDAKNRHDRRHPQKESYGIFSSLLAEDAKDPDLGDGDRDFGMGNRDFGDDMTPEDLAPDDPLEQTPQYPSFAESFL